MSIHISEKKGADSWEYRGDQLGGEGTEVLGMCYSSSIVTVYRLTPQAYHYLCGQWNQKLNVMAGIGMAPPTFTYTNIVGGVGIFAAQAKQIQQCANIKSAITMREFERYGIDGDGNHI